MAKLTDRTVKSLGAGTYGDGGGLYLQVLATGGRSWLYRFKRAKKTVWVGLGGYPTVSLADARTAALATKKQVRAGIDPIAARKEAEAERAELAGQTFKLVAGRYIEAHKAGWKNVKHAAQWTTTLETYAYGRIGEKAVGAVTVADVLAILEPVWTEKPETASRVRGRIENVLDYAKARRLRSGENPARWKGHLDHLLPARAKVAKVEHHPALPWRDLPAVMAMLTGSKGTAAACLRFLTLTAGRSGEARGARWAEFDMVAKVWTVPAERMKAGREHRVPLTDAALAILRAAYPLGATEKPADGFVFPGGRSGKPLTDAALAKALRAAGGGVATVHGMRSTFRDWAAESTNFAREVCEAALAHSNRDRVEAAYLRGDHFDKRRRLMEFWAGFITGPAKQAGTEGGEVLQLRA
jgi:integrase